MESSLYRLARLALPALVLALSLGIRGAGAQIVTATDQTPSPVGLYDVFQVTLTTNINIGALPNQNPWNDVSLTGTFTPQGGSPVAVSGFFLRESPQEYAIRFMPSQPGNHDFALTISTGAQQQDINGSFTVGAAPSSGRNHGVLRINPNNRRWWIYDDGTQVVLNGNSLHAGLDPQNIERYPNGIGGLSSFASFTAVANDAETRGYITINPNFPAELTPYTPQQHFYDMIDLRLDEYEDSLMNYLIVTGTHCDRFMGNVTSNFRGLLENSFDYPFDYNLAAGLVWDHFLEAARDRGIQIKFEVHNYVDRWSKHPFLTIPGVAAVARVGFEDPIGFITDPTALDAWEKYLRYLNARFGAYSNIIWMMGNEFSGDDSTTSAAQEQAFWDLHKDIWDNDDPYDHLRDSSAYVGAAINEIGDQRLWHGPSLFGTTNVGSGMVATAFYASSPGIHTGGAQPWLGEESTGFHRTLFNHTYRAQRWAGFVAGKYVQALSVLGHLNTPQQNNFMRVFGEVIARIDNIEGLIPRTGTTLIRNPRPVSPLGSSSGFAEGIASDREAVIYLQRVTGDALLLTLPSLPGGRNWSAQIFNPRTGERLSLVKNLPSGNTTLDLSDARSGRSVPTDHEGTLRDATPDMGFDELGAGGAPYQPVVPPLTATQSAVVRLRGGVETGFTDLATALGAGMQNGDIFELGGDGTTTAFALSGVAINHGITLRASGRLMPTRPTLTIGGNNWQVTIPEGQTFTLQNLNLALGTFTANLRAGRTVLENVAVTATNNAFFSNNAAAHGVLVEMNHCDIRAGQSAFDLANALTIVTQPVEYRIAHTFIGSGATCARVRRATMSFDSCEFFSPAATSAIFFEPQPAVDSGLPTVELTNCLLRRSNTALGNGHIRFATFDVDFIQGAKIYGNLIMHHCTILNPHPSQCTALDDVNGNHLVEGRIELVNNLFAGGGFASERLTTTPGVTGLPGTTGDILTYNNMVENLFTGAEGFPHSRGAGELFEDRWNYFDLIPDTDANKVASGGLLYFTGGSQANLTSANPQRANFRLAALVNAAANPAVGIALPLPAYRNSDYVVLLQDMDLLPEEEEETTAANPPVWTRY